MPVQIPSHRFFLYKSASDYRQRAQLTKDNAYEIVVPDGYVMISKRLELNY